MLGKILPMEPVQSEPEFNLEDYIYQVKWDGVRILAYIDGRNVILQNRNLKNKTIQYPELQNLPSLVKGSAVVLDGEMIALQNGKPDFHSIIMRNSASSPSKIKSLTEKIPVTYAVFDILFYEKDLRNLPWAERQEILQRSVKENTFLHITENFTDGKKLWKATAEQKLEGIVAKKINSKYKSGKKAKRDWLKMKHHLEVDCIVGGCTLKNNFVNSLLLGLEDENKIIYVGRASSGLSSDDLKILTQKIPVLRQETPSFCNPPKTKNAVWFQPFLQVNVEFNEWTKDKKLRAPVIKGFKKEQK